MKDALPFPAGFYVYRLIDPRNGLAFYVGKGQRGRAWSHEADVLAGKLAGNARKVAKIESIHRAGQTVEVEITAQYGLESDALEHEYTLVDADPTLTNVLPGGGGPGSTPEQIARRARIRAERLAALRAKEREEARASAIEIERQFLLQNVRMETHRDEVNQWVDTIAETKPSMRFTSQLPEAAPTAPAVIHKPDPYGIPNRKKMEKGTLRIPMYGGRR